MKRLSSVLTLRSAWRPRAWGVCCVLAVGVAAAPAISQTVEDDSAVVEAREALRRGDKVRLLALRNRLVQSGHALAMWADYWDLAARLPQATVDDVEAFYQRWPGSYVEDRLRNDWLLELGRRRDHASLLRDLPRFRMNDDREVRCYGLLAESQAGRTQTPAALAAWHAQREADDGCHQLATHLRDSGQVSAAELWHRMRLMVEVGRQRPARQAAQLIGPATAQALELLWDNPARYLSRLPAADRGQNGPLGVLAVMRVAAQDPAVAAVQLEAPWAQALKPEWAAAAWGSVARHATLKQLPEAAAWADKALAQHRRASPGRGLTDDTLAWMTRAQLRVTTQQPQAWLQVSATIDSMSPTERAEPTWAYWKARALLARSRTGSGGEAPLAEAQALLQQTASPLHFYGQLAMDELGQRGMLPGPTAPLRPEERERAAQWPGLQRSLRLLELGLRSEGVREWNFTLIGLDDRQLLAAAQLACEREIWDRCITASERTRQETEPALRYPLAFREDITTAAKGAGLEPALVMGLIRQESRFVLQARSQVGASGLMQVMPPTAQWTARRIGLTLRPDWREDRTTNLALGTSYLRMVLDEFGGSLPMALAAYNAGPNRPRRWREGAPLEPAIWAETIPIHETRDYVKKVLSNAYVYTQRMGHPAAPPLKSLLGPNIGPRAPDAPETNKDLP